MQEPVESKALHMFQSPRQALVALLLQLSRQEAAVPVALQMRV